VFGMPGGGEWMILLLIVLLLFGPSQIPKMARGLGQAMREFRKAQREITDEMNREEPTPPTAIGSDKKQPDNKPIQ
jgi:sec-independent protein translocase protein TatA